MKTTYGHDLYVSCLTDRDIQVIHLAAQNKIREMTSELHAAFWRSNLFGREQTDPDTIGDLARLLVTVMELKGN